MKIAFVGKMRSGKDTAADYIMSHEHGVIVKFADPLYKMQHAIYEILGIPEPKRDRKLLQLLGTDWGRATFGEDVWVNTLIKNLPKSGNIYNTDCRFVNEAEVLKAEGFTIVKIIRDDNLREEAGAEHVYHKSELEIDLIKWDFIITNNGTLEQFYSSLDKVLYSYGGI